MIRRFHSSSSILVLNFFRLSSTSSLTSKTEKKKQISIDSIIGRCVATNDYQKAIDTLLLLRQNEENLQANSPVSNNKKISVSSLNATLFVCEQNNKHQEAIDLAKKLDSEKRLADATWEDEAALTTLLRLKAHVGDLDGAAVCLKMILLNVVAKNPTKERLKRRSVAPLIEAYRKKLVIFGQKNDQQQLAPSSSSSSSSSFSQERKYYTSCALHLFSECQKHNVEFHVDDLENLAQIFQQTLVVDFVNDDDINNNGNKEIEIKNRQEEVRKSLTQLIRSFVDHTPILEAEGSEKEANQERQKNILLDKFESLLQICEQGSIIDNNNLPKDARVFKDCEIDSTSGICSNCHNKLDATPLTKEDSVQLQKDIESSLIEHACKKNPRRENAIRAGFKAFQNHILSQNPTILLDGANLGYYGLSSWYHLAKQEKLEHEQRKDLHDSHQHHHRQKTSPQQQQESSKFDKKKLTFVDVSPNLHFVDLAFQEMEKRGKKPLVVLHERHLEPRNLLPSYVPIVEKWRRQRAVFATPSGLNDDICWLWGIVRSETSCMVMTNDAMRDHHFALLSRRAFLRLRDRKQVKFSAKWTGSETQLFVHPAPVYSSFVQKNCGGKWHVPFFEATPKIEVVVGQEQKKRDETEERDDDELIIKWKCF